MECTTMSSSCKKNSSLSNYDGYLLLLLVLDPGRWLGKMGGYVKVILSLSLSLLSPFPLLSSLPALGALLYRSWFLWDWLWRVCLWGSGAHKIGWVNFSSSLFGFFFFFFFFFPNLCFLLPFSKLAWSRHSEVFLFEFGMEISIKCTWNWVEIISILDHNLFLISYEALRKKERRDETQFTTEIGAKTSLGPSYFLL